jgi:hypothetical protein
MSTAGAPICGLLTQHKSRADFIEEQLKEEASCSFKPKVSSSQFEASLASLVLAHSAQ